MTDCQLTVSAGGSAPAALEVAILNTLISQRLSMATLIWRFFMELAVMIAFSVRTGITVTYR